MFQLPGTLAGSIVPWSTMVSLANQLIDSLTHYYLTHDFWTINSIYVFCWCICEQHWCQWFSQNRLINFFFQNDRFMLTLFAFFCVCFFRSFLWKKHMFDHFHRQIPKRQPTTQGNITLKSVMTQSRRDGQIGELLDWESRRRKIPTPMAEAGSLLAAPIAVDWKVSEQNGGWGLAFGFSVKLMNKLTEQWMEICSFFWISIWFSHYRNAEVPCSRDIFF